MLVPLTAHRPHKEAVGFTRSPTLNKIQVTHESRLTSG